MTDDRTLVTRGPTALGADSRLAARTLADRAEQERRTLVVVARTLVVGPGDYATIGEAVAVARDGDTVLVRPGQYEESVTLEGKSITIQGDGDRDEIVVIGRSDRSTFDLRDCSATIEGVAS